MRRTAVLTLTLALTTSVVTAGATAAQAGPHGPGHERRAPAGEVMFVGNNWEGTATVVDAATYRPIATIDTIPDRRERKADILTRPDRLAFYLAIRLGIGEGHDQYTDDMFTTADGRMVAVRHRR